ncbi:PHP domain-containing protein [Natronolimnobius sp. AArcel1]|uniref:PHP domain-containing protein n=1 Tax=Natronolimnobius sp. AArcel1 TaxID=1679093 RepID=UPI0013EBC90E|nr:PHP domain-containing protein [Natronolimnobius sp. AArcel1]NGM69581.1 PHP domain-containing protein [Natronolimnobius sp. AArcel1]
MGVSDGVTTLVDCHVKVLSEGVVERAKQAGLDVLVYAPHFTRLPEIRDQAAAYSDEDLLVVPAREVFTGTWRNRKHVLAVGLTDPVPDFISLEAAMTEFERQDAAVLVPHPTFATVCLSESDIARYAETIDALETFNPKHLPFHNRRAQALANEHELAPFTSSYAHLTRTAGAAYTAFEAEINSEDDLCGALTNPAPRQIVHQDGLERWITTASELAHLGYENTWKKVDRLFLSGTEPTHPNHIAYDGRFDDVSVY